MPELPEVETTLRGIEPHIRGKTLRSVVVRNASLRWPVKINQLNHLIGHELLSVRRRSKYLLFAFTGLEERLLMHLGMSGSLMINTSANAVKKHDHIDLVFDQDVILRFNDPRRFGCCLLVDADHSLLTRLGPEPLSDDFDGEVLFRASRRRKQAVKNFIMNASTVVGVGNIYASESLFSAGIRPSLAAGRISRARYQKLADSIRTTLSAAIQAGGTTIKSQLIGQRSSFYCPSCQRF